MSKKDIRDLNLNDFPKEIKVNIWMKTEEYFVGDLHVGIDNEWRNGYYTEKGHVLIAPYVIELKFPEGLDLYNLAKNQRLSYLQNQRKLILSENEKKINEVDAQIQELISIESK